MERLLPSWPSFGEHSSVAFAPAGGYTSTAPVTFAAELPRGMRAVTPKKGRLRPPPRMLVRRKAAPPKRCPAGHGFLPHPERCEVLSVIGYIP